MKIIYALDFEEEIWSLLGLFESAKYAANELVSRGLEFDQPELDLRASTIAYCVRQAREYYSASESISLLTRPLLLSYGMLNLVKAVVIMRLSPQSDLENLFHKHGVSVDFSSIEGDLSDVRLSFQKYGVVPQLMESLQEPLLVGGSVSLDQLLSQIPDLHDMYSLVYNKPSRTIPVNPMDYGYYPDVPREIDLHEFADGLSALFGSLEVTGHVIQRFNQRFSVTSFAGAPKTLKELGILVRAISGKEYLRLGPILNGTPLLLGDASLCYLIVFCYGTLARYKAVSWGRFTDPNQSHEAELIEHSLRICRHRFLHAVVDLLFNEEYEFRFYVEQSQKSKQELIDFIYDDLVRKLTRDIHRELRGRGLL